MTQKARRTDEATTLVGPPAVRPWHSMDEKRDASPCVLGRKFVAVRTRHRNLAQAEARLKTAKSNPATTETAMERLVQRRDNAKAWLEFTVSTLEEHLKFAVARYDGSLDKVRPHPSGRPRKPLGKDECEKARKLVAYYRDSLEEFKLVAAAAAGSWTRTVCSAGKHGPCDEYRSGTVTMKWLNKTVAACRHLLAEQERKPIGGHDGTEEATKKLIASTSSIISRMAQVSGRETEEAEQLAWVEVMKTAARFDPTASNMARFNTYYTYWARRATQIRSANDCPPGKTRVKGKIVARGTIHVSDDEHDGSLLHPVTHDSFSDEASMKEAVAEALTKLSPEEQEIAALYLMGDISLRKLAEQKGLSMHQVRKLVAGVTEKLQVALKSFA